LRSSMADVDRERASLGGVLAAAERVLAEKAEIAEANKVALAEITKTLIDKRAAATAALAAQSKGQQDATDARALAEKYVSSLSTVLLPLVEGSLSDGDRATSHAELLALVGPLSLDDSLMTALPGTCLKSADARGPFEKVIMSTLEGAFRKYTADLQAREREAADAMPALGLEADRAVAARDQTQEEQRLAAAALRAAEATRLQAQGEVTAAKAACDKFEDESREMTDALAQRQADLEAFTTWNVACFETLRDKQAPRKVEPETALPEPAQGEPMQLEPEPQESVPQEPVPAEAAQN